MRRMFAALAAILLALSLSACASRTPAPAPAIGAVATLSPQTAEPAQPQTAAPQTLSPRTLAPETQEPQTAAPEAQAPENTVVPEQPGDDAACTLQPQAPENTPQQTAEPTQAPEPTPHPEASAPPQIVPGGAVFMVPGAGGETAGETAGGASADQGAQSAGLDAMALSDVMAAILKDVPDLPGTEERALESDRYEFTAFVPYSDGMQALVSEPMINATAHSVVLLRVPEGTDAAQVADTMAANMNPRKWICVSAEAASVTVRGRTILLVMSNAAAEAQIVDNFNAL